MSIQIKKFTAIAAVQFAAVASGATIASAAPDAPRKQAFERPAAVLQIAGKRHQSRRLTTGAQPGSGACGVWRCTWPTSGGGCLVWEKTKCKVINPFE